MSSIQETLIECALGSCRRSRMGVVASCRVWDKQRSQQTCFWSQYVPSVSLLTAHTLLEEEFQLKCVCTIRSCCSSRVIWSYSDFLFFFFKFKNRASSKYWVETNKQTKNMVTIKAFGSVAASELNCSLEKGRSLWCPQYGSHWLRLPRTTTQPKEHLLDVLKYLERDTI